MADDGDMKSKGSFWQPKPSFNVRGNESLIAGFDQDVDSSDFAKKSETIRRLAGIQDSGPFSRQNARESQEHYMKAIQATSLARSLIRGPMHRSNSPFHLTQHTI